MLLAALVVPRAGRAAADRLVLAVEDQSGAANAREELTALLSKALTARGYEVMAGAEVDAALAAAGVAHVESMAPATAAALQERFDATRMFVVTVRFLLPPSPRGKGPQASAAAGLTARAFKGPKPLWRNSLGLIDDRPDEAQSGRRRPLAALASARLVWSFPKGGGPLLADALELEDGSGASARVREMEIPTYDVAIERLRASRTGPRFPLRMRKAR
jgi:hypothetical protein